MRVSYGDFGLHLLGVSFLLFIILLLAFPSEIYTSILNFPLRTMLALAGLIVITTAIAASNYLSRWSSILLKRIKNERKLALFIVSLSAALSTFLTNDVTLFILIPLTLSLQKNIKNDLSKLFIFEAIAANVGSSLTPIGNPQNLYLWTTYNLPFWEFIFYMSIPASLSFAVLIIFVFISIPNKTIENIGISYEKLDEKLYLFSLSLFISFLILIQFSNFEVYAIILVLFLFLLYPQIIKKVDWPLLFTFILIFIDFGALSHIFNNFLIDFDDPHTIYLYSALLSQAISNVPATVVLAGHTQNWIALAWGANVGGNGTIIASLANIIMLRLARKRLVIMFHLYSLLFLFSTLIPLYLCLSLI